MRVPRSRAMRRLAFLAVALGLLDAAAAREAPALGARGRARVDAEEDDFSLGPSEDRVGFLPGYGVPPFPQYSGFLDASAAEPGTHLHYWFARCEQEDWATRPTVLWLNCGPGSSSVLGWLQEMGPLLVNRTGGLTRNPWAWTRQANVFVLESPAGVGYSYCEAQKKGGACSNTDNSTAATSLAALERFFFEKFPKLAENDFYVAGESYAGVYVPTLARAILERNERELLETASVSSSRDGKNENPVKLIPLAGVAVGDPCTDNAFQRDSMDALWYSNKHGLVDSEDFKTLWNECGHRYPNARAKHLSRGRWHRDSSVPGAWRGWDDYRDEKRRLDGSIEEEEEEEEKQTSERRLSPACVAAERRFRLSTSDGFSQSWRLAWLNDLSLYGPAAIVADDVPGTLDYDMARWMRRTDVRFALHVDASPSTSWPGPTDDWRYESQYAACNDLATKHSTPSMIAFYRYLAPRLRTTIVFNGDTDPCVSYEGTRAAIDAVGFLKTRGGRQRPYFVRTSNVTASFLEAKPLLFGPDLSVADAGVQFGGHVTTYEHNLQFVTVHGSGHMVPQFRPRAGAHLLRKLLTDEPFAPPLPDDAALASESERGFEKLMDAWTLEARGKEYVDGEDRGPEATRGVL